jgi:hypothetical protein
MTVRATLRPDKLIIDSRLNSNACPNYALMVAGQREGGLFSSSGAAMTCIVRATTPFYVADTSKVRGAPSYTLLARIATLTMKPDAPRYCSITPESYR